MFSNLMFILQDLYPEQEHEDYSESNKRKMSRAEMLFVIYNIVLGDHGDFLSIKTTLTPLILYFIFIVLTLLMFIILMNFIISLVGMEFGGVVEVKDRTYLYEKTKIVAEIDRSLSDKEAKDLTQQNNINSYLMICQTKTVLASAEKQVESSSMSKEKRRTYNFSRIYYELNDKVDVKFGSICTGCHKTLEPRCPQFYCYFCNIYYCADCGNKIDTSKSGSFSLIHPHNMIWIDVKNIKGMKQIDKYKMGRIKIFKENVQNHKNAGCNGCQKDLLNNCRWVCLSCKPGKYRPDGYVDFCNKCMNIIKSKVSEGPEYDEMQKNLLTEEHENDSHIYLRIMFNEEYAY